MADRRADRVGQQLGPYRLTRLLGAGGFGEVYEADHRLLQQKRAIKLLLERHFHDPTQRERFLREARTLAPLEHPNILPVLEVGEEGTVLYLVMPFYHRGTLNDLLKPRTTPLPLTVVERLLAQMCAAVDYAHGRHIAHLDLKPENMLLHEDGRLVLSDFGLAHLIKQGRLEAGSSADWGTPYYMAPEQIRGEPEPRSDLYALGVILYQLHTTQRPFTGTTPEAVMMKHLLEVPPPLRAASPDAPLSLEPVLRKALEKRPEERYATAEALLADFRRAVDTSSSQNAQSPAPNVSPISHTQPPDRPIPTATFIPSTSTPRPAQSANMLQPMGRGCEIQLNNGYICGITPIGRCATCGHAFCYTHQAREWHSYGPVPYVEVPYVDMCAPCLAKAKADKEKRQREAQAKEDEAREYFMSGAARTDLLTSGVLPVNIYSFSRQWEPPNKTFFRGRYIVKGVRNVGHGWILGEFWWSYNDNPHETSGGTTKPWLTALLDVSHDDPIVNYEVGYLGPGRVETFSSLNSTLVRVQPCAEGYENLSWERDDRFKAYPEMRLGWNEAMQAVKRLAGELGATRPALQPTILPEIPESAPNIAEPANVTKATAAVCEVDNCGILAVGRCTTCKRAFCSSHQALTREIRYVDMCAPCFAKQQAEREARGQAPADSPRRYFPQVAKTDLLTAGVPTVEIYEVRSEWKPGRFGLGQRQVDVVTTLGSGWILGTFKWGYSKAIPYGSERVSGDWLTALICEGPSWLRNSNSYYSFIRVRPYPPGYQRVGNDHDGFSGDLEEARQAVKRLIRESN